MHFNKNVQTSVGLTIIIFLAAGLTGLILYSWNWAGVYLASMVNNLL